MFRSMLALGLTLALASPAFAQEQSSQTPPAASTTDDGSMPQTAPAADSQATTDQQQPMQQHRHRHAHAHPPYNPAAEALTGDDAKTAAYQQSDREKSYPVVDHGHVPGDPNVIDHSADQAAVADPTSASITVLPTH